MNTFMYKLLFWLFLFTLPSLACGMQTIPAEVRTDSEVKFTDTQPTAEESMDVNMVATGDLWIRPTAGDLGRALGELHNGEVVTCTEFAVVGDSIWCKHERGWSNARWLEAK